MEKWFGCLAGFDERKEVYPGDGAVAGLEEHTAAVVHDAAVTAATAVA